MNITHVGSALDTFLSSKLSWAGATAKTALGLANTLVTEEISFSGKSEGSFSEKKGKSEGLLVSHSNMHSLTETSERRRPQ